MNKIFPLAFGGRYYDRGRDVALETMDQACVANSFHQFCYGVKPTLRSTSGGQYNVGQSLLWTYRLRYAP